MAVRILRYEVPVDDRAHSITLQGDVVHVGYRDPRAVYPVVGWDERGGCGDPVVEFWAIADDNRRKPPADFIVVGTGQDWPRGANYVGTALAPHGIAVWHLLKI